MVRTHNTQARGTISTSINLSASGRTAWITKTRTICPAVITIKKSKVIWSHLRARYLKISKNLTQQIAIMGFTVLLKKLAPNLKIKKDLNPIAKIMTRDPKGKIRQLLPTSWIGSKARSKPWKKMAILAWSAELISPFKKLICKIKS